MSSSAAPTTLEDGTPQVADSDKPDSVAQVPKPPDNPDLGAAKTFLLLSAVFLSMFLVALDRTIISTVRSTPPKTTHLTYTDTNVLTGNSSDHPGVQFPPGCWLVRECLLVDLLCIPIAVWQIVCHVPSPMGPHL